MRYSSISQPEHLAAALYYAALGWAVLPLHTIKNRACSCGNKNCNSPGKHPRCSHGVKDATIDPITISRWWKKWPKANIGIATGAISHLLVLDIDPRHGGTESLDQLSDRYGKLPDTIESLTGGDGRHIFFSSNGHKVPSVLSLTLLYICSLSV